jgi:hypothetical protein
LYSTWNPVSFVELSAQFSRTLPALIPLAVSPDGAAGTAGAAGITK